MHYLKKKSTGKGEKLPLRATSEQRASQHHREEADDGKGKGLEWLVSKRTIRRVEIMVLERMIDMVDAGFGEQLGEFEGAEKVVSPELSKIFRVRNV
ncbi:hypothetical protein CsatB_026982 [Cannabis sativa]